MPNWEDCGHPSRLVIRAAAIREGITIIPGSTLAETFLTGRPATPKNATIYRWKPITTVSSIIIAFDTLYTWGT